MELVKINGIIIYDNTVRFGDLVKPEDLVPEGFRKSRSVALNLNNALAADPRVKISIIPLGYGNTISRRLY